MFWTFVGTPSIRRANLDGSNMEILVHDELTSPGTYMQLQAEKPNGIFPPQLVLVALVGYMA